MHMLDGKNQRNFDSLEQEYLYGFLDDDEDDMLCDYCEQPIDDKYYEIGKDCLCPKCVDDLYLKYRY